MSKNDYKKGLTDAMEAYVDFGRKQEEAINHIAKETGKVGEKVNKLGEQIGIMADYITDKEKEQLYNLHMIVDIKELDGLTKHLLVAILYELSKKGTSEEQKNYVRGIQNYLGIKNVQTSINFGVVENIEDIISSKAIMQSVLEFLYIKTCTWEMSDEEEELLDSFNLNMKSRKEIMGHIEAIVSAVGIKGLSEKYGFVPKECVKEESNEQEVLDYMFDIPENIAEKIKMCPFAIIKNYVVWTNNNNKEEIFIYLWSKSNQKIEEHKIVNQIGEDTIGLTVAGEQIVLFSYSCYRNKALLYNIDTKSVDLIKFSIETDEFFGTNISFIIGNELYLICKSHRSIILLNRYSNEEIVINKNVGYNYNLGHNNRFQTVCIAESKVFYIDYLERECSNKDKCLIQCYDLDTKISTEFISLNNVVKIMYFDRRLYMICDTGNDVELYSLGIDDIEKNLKKHFSVEAYIEYEFIGCFDMPYFAFVGRNQSFPVYLYDAIKDELIKVIDGCKSTSTEKWFLHSKYTESAGYVSVVGDWLVYRTCEATNDNKWIRVKPTDKKVKWK